MDRLQLALRRYAQIVSEPVQNWDVPLNYLQVWLCEDVNAVLDIYTRRPAFRERASWAIRVLRPNAATPERTLVDRVDAELVRCAKALRKLTQHKLLHRAISKILPPEPTVVAETVEITGGGPTQLHAKRDLIDHTAIELCQVDNIAERSWTDLVNVSDYFEPQQEFVQDDSGQFIQRGEWIVSLNPDLLPVGNFVVRCLLKRVALRMDCLESILRRTHSGLRQVQPKYDKDREEVDSSWAALSRSVQDLNSLLRTERETLLCDACIVATQIYGAFHPEPDLGWLGLDDCYVEQGRSILAARTRQSQSAELFDRVATALGELKHLHAGEDPQRPEIEDAIASGGLVIVETTREAYWEGRKLEKLPPRSWSLLFSLARRALLHSAVEFRDVFGIDALTNSAMSTVWGRLKARLPASLSRLVEPGELPRTYQLNLDSHRIFFIESGGGN